MILVFNELGNVSPHSLESLRGHETRVSQGKVRVLARSVIFLVYRFMYLGFIPDEIYYLSSIVFRS